MIKISPSSIFPSSNNKRRATPGRHPAWRDGVTHLPSRQKARLRIEDSITWPSGRYSATSLGVLGSTPMAGIPTRARARLYTSRWVVFVLVNTEGVVGSVSRYTEMRDWSVAKPEVGFDVAAMKRPSGLFSLGTGVDSTEIFPRCERTMRIYSAISLGTKSGDVLPQHLVRLAGILSSQGRIA